MEVAVNSVVIYHSICAGFNVSNQLSVSRPKLGSAEDFPETYHAFLKKHRHFIVRYVPFRIAAVVHKFSKERKGGKSGPEGESELRIGPGYASERS